MDTFWECYQYLFPNKGTKVPKLVFSVLCMWSIYFSYNFDDDLLCVPYKILRIQLVLINEFSFYFYLVYLLRASFKNYQFIVYIFYDSYRFQNIRRSNTLAFDIHLINFPLSSFCGHIMLCSPLLMSCYSLCFLHTMYADVYAIIDLF